jgi:hypothetical protein
MRSLSIASVAGITGIIIGLWGNSFLGRGYQSTYFEANDIENFFLKNSTIPDVSIHLSEVVGANWKSACFLGVGAGVASSLNDELGSDSWGLKSGRIIDEGLLDYLSKIILHDEDGAVYVMNFDERIYKFSNPSNCHLIGNLLISRSSKEINPDADGYGDHLITYRITLKE